MKKYNPLQAIEDMAKNKKINFFNYMALGGFEIIKENEKEDLIINDKDLIISFIMTEEQYNNFLESIILVFEIAELSAIIADLMNKDYIKLVKLELLEENEYGISFIRKINSLIEAELLGTDDKYIGDRVI